MASSTLTLPSRKVSKADESGMYAVACIVRFDEDAGYYVEWDSNPPTQSWVQPADLVSCVPLLLAFHDGDWTALPEALHASARQVCNPDAILIADLTREESRCQGQLLAQVAHGSVFLLTALAQAMSWEEAASYVTSTLDTLADAAHGAITSPEYFTTLREMLSPQTTTDASEVGTYFRRVLQPLAPEGWTFCDPVMFCNLAQGMMPNFRACLIPHNSGTVTILPCFHASLLPDGVGHWTVLVFDWKHGVRMRVVLFDPMGGMPQQSHILAVQTYAAWLTSKGVASAFPPIASKLETLSRRNFQAPSVTDCGIWIMSFARCILGGEVPAIPRKSQIPFMRAVLTTELLTRQRVCRTIHPQPNLVGCFAVPDIAIGEVRRSC